MNRPRFKLRTLLVLMIALGIAFLACSKWPVNESVTVTVTQMAYKGANKLVPVQTTTIETIVRQPTLGEWAVRSVVFSAIIISAAAMIGHIRHRTASAQ